MYSDTLQDQLTGALGKVSWFDSGGDVYHCSYHFTLRIIPNDYEMPVKTKD